MIVVLRGSSNCFCRVGFCNLYWHLLGICDGSVGVWVKVLSSDVQVGAAHSECCVVFYVDERCPMKLNSVVATLTSDKVLFYCDGTWYNGQMKMGGLGLEFMSLTCISSWGMTVGLSPPYGEKKLM